MNDNCSLLYRLVLIEHEYYRSVLFCYSILFFYLIFYHLKKNWAKNISHSWFYSKTNVGILWILTVYICYFISYCPNRPSAVIRIRNYTTVYYCIADTVIGTSQGPFGTGSGSISRG